MPVILSPTYLPNIQGNILTPFAKKRFLYLFARFGEPPRARRWLAEVVADADFASAQKMLDEPTRPTWLAVAFTHPGLTAIAPGLEQDLTPFTAFSQGAAGVPGGPPSAALVGDQAASDPAEWVVGNPDRSPVDVVLTIAADDDETLAACAAREWARAARHDLNVLDVDQGRTGSTLGQFAAPLAGGTEHFGFRDGISQPGVRGFTPEVIRHRRLEAAHQPGSPIIASGEFVLGYDAEPKFYPGTGPRRPIPPDWMYNGSFQVLLRLTQDVPGWRAQTRFRTRTAVVDVAPSVIGRSTGGAPLTTVGYGGDNDFTYADDPDGAQTPLYAHARKTNPRDDTRYHDRQHRMLRRGVPFGEPLDEGAADDGTDRGMVFNAFMASIEDQFEYVQRQWTHPVTAAGGPDALVGASRAGRPLRQEGGETLTVSFEPFVRTSGAAYLFAPSLPTLRRLGSGEPVALRTS